MRTTMWRQPTDLRALLADPGPVEAQAERLARAADLHRRALARAGTPPTTASGCSARPMSRPGAVQAMDASLYGLPAREGDAVLV